MNLIFSKNHFIVLRSESLFILLMILNLNVFSQIKLNESKISPILFQSIKSISKTEKLKFIITVSGNTLPDQINVLDARAKKINKYGPYTYFEIHVTANELTSIVIPEPNVIFAEVATRKPIEELLVGDLDLSVNKINLAHRNFPQWNGDGMTVSVKENKPDTSDIDFTGRFLSTNLASSTVSSHASIISTMIAGGGNSWYLGKGTAWGSSISSSDFAYLLPDASAAYLQYNISVQNHSYGVGIENYYGADAVAYDETVIENPYLVHVFSSGNSGTLANNTGVYAGLTGFANLTGSFKTAKNSIVVGATDSFNVVTSFSSKGPAFDGRIKPELVAFGEDGSSGAAALVSGTALIMQNSYKQLYGSLPASSLIKAVLINSADDIGNKEVDFTNGYGSLNALNALKTLQSGRFVNDSVLNSDMKLFSISLPSGIKKIKVTLTWNDPPSFPNTSKSLVNDLDLELFYPVSGQSWKPWVLNSFPNLDSIQQLAVRKRDSLNNVEQITLDNPQPGNYEFHVTGYNLSTTSQDFNLAFQFDSSDVFDWQFPVRNDFVISNSMNTLRWSSSLSDSIGVLQYSLDNGINWQTIIDSVNLSTGYYKWNTPELANKALLRMTVSSIQYTTDTFTISSRTQTGVGFNCSDSFMFYWNKIPGISNYTVFKLGDKYLEPITSTTDSFYVMAKNVSSTLSYAVAPLIGNTAGVKSYTFNYTTQGVECYIRSFLSSLNNDSAFLDLSLGTLYHISKIVLEKITGTNYLPLQQLTTFSNLQIKFFDSQLKNGSNTYRIKLVLADGSIEYSQPETVYYLTGNPFFVYPNPSINNHPFKILASDIVEPITLQVINVYGQNVYDLIIEDENSIMSSEMLIQGLYLFRFLRNGKEEEVIKVIVI